MYRFIISIALIINTSGIEFLEAQSADWQPVVRDIMISYKDSLVKAQILTQSENIETSNDLTYYWYSQNKIHTNMGGYTGSLLHGQYQVYDNDKKLITQGYFDHGLKSGTWKYWNSRGILKQFIEFKKGLLDGACCIFNERGVQIEKRNYKNGVLQLEDNSNLKIWKGDKEKHKQITDSLATDTLQNNILP